jgi:hypothetical protein
MNKIVKKALLKSLGLNLLAGLICLVPFLFLKGDGIINWGITLLIIAPFSLIVQLIQSIIYINNIESKETGQGMLLSIGIILLIGFAACSPLWF